MNNGKILLIRTAVKHRRGANNEKIILIRTAAVRIAFSFLALQGSNFEKWFDFHERHLKLFVLLYTLKNKIVFTTWNVITYEKLHMPGVIYVASTDSHAVQWTSTLFTTLPCQGEVRSMSNYSWSEFLFYTEQFDTNFVKFWQFFKIWPL